MATDRGHAELPERGDDRHGHDDDLHAGGAEVDQEHVRGAQLLQAAHGAPGALADHIAEDEDGDRREQADEAFVGRFAGPFVEEFLRKRKEEERYELRSL